MKNLRFCLMDAHFSGEKRHAQEVMKELGITYKHAVPQSIIDSWWFLCCENVPSELPSFITEIIKDNNFNKIVGNGISQNDANKLYSYIEDKIED